MHQNLVQVFHQSRKRMHCSTIS